MFRNYKKYEVFDDGRVYSYKSKRFLKLKKDKRGYSRICLSDNNGEIKNYQLHRVVYESIRGEIPEGLQVNHIDEDKSNNSISNLNLMTPKANCNFGSRNERIAEKLTNRTDLSKQVGAYNKDGVLIMTFSSTAEAQRAGFSSGHISKCCRGERKSHKGYQWKYMS